MKLPAEWEDITLQTFQNGPDLVEVCRKFARQDKGFLFLYGPQGVGKTHLAVGTLKEIDREYPTLVPTQAGPGGDQVLVTGEFWFGDVMVDRLWHRRVSSQTEFVAMSDLIRKLRKSVSQRRLSMAQELGLGKEESALTMDEILDRCIEVHALVLDDLGSERYTDFVFENLYLIISERYSYRAERVTIVTSNLDLDVISEKIDPRLASRLGAGTVLPMEGTDYRKRSS